MNLPLVKEYVGLSFCNSRTQLACDAGLYQKFYSYDVSKSCAECPLECDQINYGLSLSSSSYPSQAYYKYLLKNPVILNNFDNNISAVTFETLKRKILGINVYYDVNIII